MERGTVKIGKNSYVPTTLGGKPGFKKEGPIQKLPDASSSMPLKSKSKLPMAKRRHHSSGQTEFPETPAPKCLKKHVDEHWGGVVPDYDK